MPGDYKKFYEGVYRSIVEGEAVPVSSDDGIKVMKVIKKYPNKKPHIINAIVVMNINIKVDYIVIKVSVMFKNQIVWKILHLN